MRRSHTKTVDLYLDFVSAYSWLAVVQARDFEREHGCRFRVRGMVFGALLEQIGRRAIAQVPASRGYAVYDVAREGHRLGVSFVGPPEHPFVTLKALRALTIWQDDERALDLARTLFAVCWEQGRDLSDIEVVRAAVSAAGFDAGDDASAFASRINAPEIKAALRANTDEAVARGVFGAPFFFYDGEPFYGQDRMPQLAARLGGAPRPPAAVLDAARRSAGVDLPLDRPSDLGGAR